ncbi:MAG TPA: response regulator transcription factor [Gaiella sp.]
MGEVRSRSAVIVDRYPLWLEALGRLLAESGVEVLGSARRIEDGLSLVEEHRPDLLVLGIGENDEEDDAWHDAVRELHVRLPTLRTVVVSAKTDEETIESAFAAGVAAYCVKSAAPEDLAVAIRQPFDQTIHLARSRSLPLAGTPVQTHATGRPELTRREIEILMLVAEGYSNSQLARMLWVTEQTVKFHLSNIYRKLNVANRTEASRWAQLQGLLTPETGPRESTAA